MTAYAREQADATRPEHISRETRPSQSVAQIQTHGRPTVEIAPGAWLTRMSDSEWGLWVRVGDRAVKHGEFRSEGEARAKWKEMGR